MTLKWIRKLLGTDGKEMENSVDIESSKSIVEIDGKDVPMDALVNAFNEAEEKKRKALENRAPADTDLIDVGGGRKVSIADLKNAYKAKNEEADEERKKADEEEKKRDEERKNAEEKDKLEKEHEDGKHDEDEKKNCGMCNKRKNDAGRKHFQRIDSLANSRPSDFTDELPERPDGFEEGRRRFGSEKPAAK